MSPTQYTDNGQTIIREIITRHTLSNFNRVRISLLYLDMDVGVGLQNGQGSNPQIMLQYSKDNGRTWSAERWVSLGAVGLYLTRVIWRRFGSTRDATFKIRMSDPVKFVIAEGAINVSEREQH
jgi:Neuraminidase (sialidase)